MIEGEKMESYEKGFWSWSVFLLSKYWLPLLFEEILGASLSLSLSFLYAPSLEDLGVLTIFRGEKSLLQKLLFKWNGMDWLSVNIGGGRIFRNGVIHANMVKP
jgi:hypothetical protein